jgi:hypothetical protein
VPWAAYARDDIPLSYIPNPFTINQLQEYIPSGFFFLYAFFFRQKMAAA